MIFRHAEILAGLVFRNLVLVQWLSNLFGLGVSWIGPVPKCIRRGTAITVQSSMLYSRVTLFKLRSFFGFHFRRSVFVLHGGGQLWGWLVDGECRYSVTDPVHRYTFPIGWGRDGDATEASLGVRIAVLAWSHNDQGLGHSGRDCADTACWWPTKLRIVRGADLP